MPPIAKLKNKDNNINYKINENDDKIPNHIKEKNSKIYSNAPNVAKSKNNYEITINKPKKEITYNENMPILLLMLYMVIIFLSKKVN